MEKREILEKRFDDSQLQWYIVITSKKQNQALWKHNLRRNIWGELNGKASEIPGFFFGFPGIQNALKTSGFGALPQVKNQGVHSLLQTFWGEQHALRQPRFVF